MFFFFSSRRRHTRYWRDWSSDVCSSDLLRKNPAHGSSTLRTLCLAGPECSAVHPVPLENEPTLVLGSSGKAGSRYSSLNPTTGEHPKDMATVRLRRSSPFRLGAVSPLTAPRRSRLLLLLREGLAELPLLVLGQVGRDDL